MPSSSSLRNHRQNQLDIWCVREWRNQEELHNVRSHARICVGIFRKRITKRKEKLRRCGWKLKKFSARWCKTCIHSFFRLLWKKMVQRLANKLQLTDKELWWPFADKNVEYPIQKKKKNVVGSILVLVPGRADNTTDFEFLKSYVVFAEKLYYFTRPITRSVSMYSNEFSFSIHSVHLCLHINQVVPDIVGIECQKIPNLIVASEYARKAAALCHSIASLHWTQSALVSKPKTALQRRWNTTKHTQPIHERNFDVKRVLNFSNDAVSCLKTISNTQQKTVEGIECRERDEKKMKKADTTRN